MLSFKTQAFFSAKNNYPLLCVSLYSVVKFFSIQFPAKKFLYKFYFHDYSLF